MSLGGICGRCNEAFGCGKTLNQKEGWAYHDHDCNLTYRGPISHRVGTVFKNDQPDYYDRLVVGFTMLSDDFDGVSTRNY